MIGGVLSKAYPDNMTPPHFQVVHEWEEEIAKRLGVPVRKIFVESNPAPSKFRITPKLMRLRHIIAGKVFLTFPLIRRMICDRLRPPFTQDISLPLSVCFLMSVHIKEVSMLSGNNCIPVFLDVWSDFNIEEVVRRTKGFRLFYVTSRDVYNRVKATSPQSNVHYMPLSVADKYHSENFSAYRNKTIDVLHSSRKNPVLHEYMMQYADKHSGLDYVYKENGEYISTLRGNIGRCLSREDYMNLIASAKVCLVGCSGIDGSRADTYGICFPTPRFYESAVLGCALIGRYPENQEFRELNMSRYCPNITSYDQFTHELERALSQTPEELYAQNRDFILGSLTSKRAEQIRHDLEELTCGQNS